jgi:hypothetical protein
MEVLESLVDLYLSDVPQLKEHPYIKNKLRDDALVYAETIFLSKMTRKNFLSQLRQVDNGDNSARMHEVVNQTIGQIRENSKFSSTQRTELEKFYKGLRKDLGLNEIESPDVQKAIEIGTKMGDCYQLESAPGKMDSKMTEACDPFMKEYKDYCVKTFGTDEYSGDKPENKKVAGFKEIMFDTRNDVAEAKKK